MIDLVLEAGIMKGRCDRHGTPNRRQQGIIRNLNFEIATTPGYFRGW